MQQTFSPNLFLFQSFVGQVLREGKKYIKSPPFDTLEPQALINANKHQKIDLYHPYFLAAMSHNRTKEVACSSYQKLINQGLIDSQSLPVQLISSILMACSNQGGSTTGSSSVGSVTISNAQQSHNIYVGNLLKSMMLQLPLPSVQIQAALNYILEGVRSKYTDFYTSLIQQIYVGLLIPHRNPPLTRFLELYLQNYIIVEVETHLNDIQFNFNRTKIQSCHMCVHQGKIGQGKWGICLFCGQPANNYDKKQLYPVCSIICKQFLNDLQYQCQGNDHFDLFLWLLQYLPCNDAIVYSLLARQIPYRTYTREQVEYILKYAIHGINNTILAPSCLQIYRYIIFNYRHIYGLSVYCQVFYLQIINHVEQIIIPNYKINNINQIPLVATIIDLLARQDVFLEIYTQFDCHLFQYNMLTRMLNILTQYAKVHECVVKGIYRILSMIMDRIVYQKNNRQYHINLKQIRIKNKYQKVIDIFNKKPSKGIQQLKKLFIVQHGQQESIEMSQISKSLKSSQNLQQSSSMQEIQSQSLSIPKMEDEIMMKKVISEQNTDKQISQNLKQSSLSIEDKNIMKQQYHINSHQIALFIERNLQSEIKIQHKPLLSKEAVGQYFGSNNEQAQQVYHEFIKLIDFNNLEVDDCLRTVFHKFNLPKQTQQIQRIIDKLSIQMLPHSGLQQIDGVYQYIYVLMMVQTGRNPNVQQKDRINLQNFLNMSKYIKGGIPQNKLTTDFNRIIENPLDNTMKYNDESIFQKKYPLVDQSQQPQDQLNHKQLLIYIWQYLFISLVHNDNIVGLYQCIVLYGCLGLHQQQLSFFQHMQKLYELHQFQLCRDQFVQFAINHTNCVLGSSWYFIINLFYHLEQNSNLDYHTSKIDELLHNSKNICKERLTEFLEALCQFSSSQVRKDANYHRQLFVLKHITEIVQYNIDRIPLMWTEIWGILGVYFRNICLHPRRQISMLAMDSLKQLSIKIMKIDRQADHHQQIIYGYQYIFQRCNSYLRDLCINILLNIICKDMLAGWEQIYAILNINDSTDQKIIIRIVDKMITQIGINKLPTVLPLHQLLLRELRMATDSENILGILDKMWLISQYINERDIWLQTMRSIRDIYKISMNSNLLNLFYRICNKCILHYPQQQKKNNKSERKLSLYDENINDEYLSINKIIYSQIITVLIFLLDDKNIKNSMKLMIFVKQGLQCFTELNPQYVIRYLGQSQGFIGFLHIWSMYMNSSNFKILFTFIIKNYLNRYIFPIINELKYHKNKLQLINWIINQYNGKYSNNTNNFTSYHQIYPLEVLNLRQQDSDFNKKLIDILRQNTIKSFKMNLIQFTLSAQQFTQKSIINLVFLDIITMLHEHNCLVQLTKEYLKQYHQKIIYTYQSIRTINRLLFLRTFLWNNGFLKYNSYQQASHSNVKLLPGLHKHEFKTLKFMLKWMKWNQIEIEVINFLQQYLDHLSYKLQLKQHTYENIRINIENRSSQKQSSTSSNTQIRQIYSLDVNMWLLNATPILHMVLKLLTVRIKNHKQLNYSNIFAFCLQLCQHRIKRQIVTQCSELMAALLPHLKIQDSQTKVSKDKKDKEE